MSAIDKKTVALDFTSVECYTNYAKDGLLYQGFCFGPKVYIAEGALEFKGGNKINKC